MLQVLDSFLWLTQNAVTSKQLGDILSLATNILLEYRAMTDLLTTAERDSPILT